MKMGSKAILGALAALAAATAQAQAPAYVPPPPPGYEPPPPPGYAPPRYVPYGLPPGYHEHDGFYLRLELGAGYLQSKTTDAGLDSRIHGGAGEFGIAVGGAVGENLILAGHFFAMGAADPTYTSHGSSYGIYDSSWSLWGVGPQITYYLMPANVYVSGTVGFTRLTETINGDSSSSDWGVGMAFSVGKEWWVSDNWGIGLACQLFGATNDVTDPSGPKVTYRTWGIAGAFSATYN